MNDDDLTTMVDAYAVRYRLAGDAKRELLRMVTEVRDDGVGDVKFIFDTPVVITRMEDDDVAGKELLRAVWSKYQLKTDEETE
jgi:hypothetical protein